MAQLPVNNAPQQPVVDEQGSAPPEEQKMFEQIVDSSMTIVYQPKFWGHLKSAMQSDEPSIMLGDMIGQIVNKVVDQLTQQNGVPFPPDPVVYALAQDIVPKVLEDLQEAGAQELPDEEVEAVIFRAINVVREGMTSRGEVDDAAAQQNWAQFQQMEQSGELSGIFGQAQQQQPQEQPPMNRRQRRAQAAIQRKGGTV